MPDDLDLAWLSERERRMVLLDLRAREVRIVGERGRSRVRGPRVLRAVAPLRQPPPRPEPATPTPPPDRIERARADAERAERLWRARIEARTATKAARAARRQAEQERAAAKRREHYRAPVWSGDAPAPAGAVPDPEFVAVLAAQLAGLVRPAEP